MPPAQTPTRTGWTACSAPARARRRSPATCTPGRTTRTGRTRCVTPGRPPTAPTLPAPANPRSRFALRPQGAAVRKTPSADGERRRQRRAVVLPILRPRRLLGTRERAHRGRQRVLRAVAGGRRRGLAAARALEPLHQRQPLLDVVVGDVALHLVHADPELGGPHVVLRVADGGHDRDAERVQEADERLVGEGIAAGAVWETAPGGLVRGGFS